MEDKEIVTLRTHPLYPEAPIKLPGTLIEMELK
jgi:hypothetical protein